MSEQQAVNDLLKALEAKASFSKTPFLCFQVETGGTQIGVPDLYLVIGKTAIWLECKHLDCFKSYCIHFQPMQVQTLKRLKKQGQHAFVLVMRGGGEYLLLDPDDLPVGCEAYKFNKNMWNGGVWGMDFVQLWDKLKEL